ncbi:MAG TPA: DUF2079 domain-containing protein, partial [Candidatus Saccharimonadales bacterium]|nr:DUF2079 domain-containing protein [Candidatus Saccharimonadales bacterium]
MKSKVLTILKIIIGWPLSLVALLFIGKLVWAHGNDLSHLLHPQLVLLAISIIFFLIYFSLRAYFWHKLLEAKGHIVPLQETPFLWSLSELQRYIPGNIWAFLGRTNLFSQKGIQKKTILYSLIHEAQFLVIGGLIVSLLSTKIILHSFLPHIPFWPTFITAVIVVAMGVYVFTNSYQFLKNKKISAFLPQLPFNINLMLLLYMALALLFYGIGNFFAVATWFSLIHANLYITSAFFVFSFLVGYLSFITPMGLGVREAVTTAGLTQYMTLANAGIASIASRLVLIVSELLFVGLAFLFSRIKKEIIDQLGVFWSTHKYTIILTFSILFYVVYFTTASFLRYSNYYTGRFDLGNMDQTVWNSAHGRIFQLTNPDGTNIISRLSVHADFILVLLAPLYCIWQDPRMLLLIQTVVLSLGAIFVYKIGQKVLKHNALSLTLAVLFLLNPGVNHSNLYDFHAVTLATTFLLGAWYYLLENKVWPFVLLLILA